MRIPSEGRYVLHHIFNPTKIDGQKINRMYMYISEHEHGMPYLSISSTTELSNVYIGIGCSAVRYTKLVSNRIKMEPCHARSLSTASGHIGSLVSEWGFTTTCGTFEEN